MCFCKTALANSGSSLYAPRYFLYDPFNEHEAANPVAAISNGVKPNDASGVLVVLKPPIKPPIGARPAPSTPYQHAVTDRGPQMFTADLFGNPIYPPDWERPDDNLDCGISYQDLAYVVRGGEVTVIELLEAFDLDPEPVIARLKADGTIDDDLKPINPIDRDEWTEETEELDAALIKVFAHHRRA
jgi:hypothetical protein